MNETNKCQFYDHFWLFFHQLYVIFHKTEVQTVILRCLTGLNSDWFKGYDTKCKYFHFGFLQFCTKTLICIFCNFAFCVISIVPIKIQTCKEPQNDRLNLSFVKDKHTVVEKMVKNGRKMGICQLLFFESQPSRCEASIYI